MARRPVPHLRDGCVSHLHRPPTGRPLCCTSAHDSPNSYSNVLYVRGAKPKLAYLAHRVSKTDRFRPESCCIVGNYYSMRKCFGWDVARGGIWAHNALAGGEHSKAVSYFMRALRLNPSFLSAWTLMGHEYMELSNAVAAVCTTASAGLWLASCARAGALLSQGGGH